MKINYDKIDLQVTKIESNKKVNEQNKAEILKSENKQINEVRKMFLDIKKLLENREEAII